MNELLTTDEAAAYLRISERKLYELVSAGAVPCSKVTGRWVFPRAALDRWVMSGMAELPGLLPVDAPPIVGGSQDSLLDWALRASNCGLAALPEGSENGLHRLARSDVIAAGIHLHRLTDDDEYANVETVAQAPGLHDAVVISFARREQGLLVAPGNKLKLTDIASAVQKRARMAQRQSGAGAQLLLLRLLHMAGLSPDAVTRVEPEFATGPDLAHAVRIGRADCGVAPRSAAREAGLDFVSLAWERFDLVLRQRDYFRPAPQALLTFMRTAAFAERATELSGYDIADSGAVRRLP